MRTARSALLVGGAVAAVLFGALPARADSPPPAPTGSISGTVTDASGSPLAGVCVTAYPDDNPPEPRYQPDTTGVTSAPSDPTGGYTIPGLADGAYFVHFADCTGNNDYPVWNNQASSFNGAAPVNIQSGRPLAGVNARLPAGASVTGTVTDTSGAPLAGICVVGNATGPAPSNVYGPTDTVFTSSDGTYTLPVQAGEEYAVEFRGCQGQANYVVQYYDNASSLGSATAVSASAAQVRAGVDAVMQPGGSISGLLTDSGGHPVTGMCVSVTPPPTPGFFGDYIATPDSSGAYTVDQLPADTYTVAFFECGPNWFTENWASQWYKHEPSQSSADPVTVATGEAVSGIDATILPAGTISGTVTNQSGQPVPGICVNASASGAVEWGNWSGQATTDQNGHYRIPGLGTGPYTLRFNGCTPQTQPYYIPAWYTGGSSSATSVDVTTGQDTTGIDEGMVEGGTLGGTVSFAAGTPSGMVCITAEGPTGSYTWYSNGGGAYRIPDLPAGRYSVEFGGCQGATSYPAQWYDDRNGPTAADLVTVSAGQDTNGIDATIGAPTRGPAPVVSGVAPSSGPEAGGQTVTIFGTGFTGASSVAFGTTGAAFTVVSDTQITAAVPASSTAGPVSVSVTTPGGASAASAGAVYTYLAPPQVTSVSPARGSTSGGTTVDIVGTNLSGASAVAFGGVAATAVTIVDDSHLTTTAPRGTAGAVDITITGPGGTSPTGPADRFTYVPPPVITSLTPADGPAGGGSLVLIQGQRLTNVDTVMFGKNKGTIVRTLSAGELVVKAPAGTAGTVDVVLSAAGITSDVTPADRYTYLG